MESASEILDLCTLGVALDALNCGAAIVDRSGKLVFVNERLSQMAKQPREQLTGQNITDLQERADGEARLRRMQEHFEEARQGESYLLLPDRSHLPVIATAAPLRSGSANDHYRLLTLVDITAQKEVEEDLRNQYAIIAELSNTVMDQAMSLKDHSAVLEQRVRQRTAELHEANLDAIVMLAMASEAKDQDTGDHVRRLRALTEAIAKRLGMKDAAATAIGYASILHDVGKMHVPDRILQKNGPLTAEERATMQEHTLTGERIIADKPFFAMARRVARHHHENWDGSGYPDRLAGERIPIEARIVHVADVYDALTNVRAYKPAWPREQAMAEIRRGSGTMFEPGVVKAFESAQAMVT